ncbi:MAG: TolC family protein [Betaproteobacteria bacterium]
MTRRPEGRASRLPAWRLLAGLVLVGCLGSAPSARAQAVQDQQVLRNPLSPRTLAQALAVRNLELAYGRDSVAIGASLATAEAALYEPILFSSLKRSSTERQRTTEEKSSNIFVQQDNVLSENGRTAEAGVRQRLPTGGELSVSGRHAQRASNVLAKSAPPVTVEMNAALVLTFKQPLWKGSGVAVTETDKRVAEVEAEVAQWQYLQQLNKVLAEGLSLYWQTEVAAQAVRLREQLLASTDSLAQDARARIEAGKLAPRANLELTRARLAREADLGRALQNRDELKLRLLSSLDLDSAYMAQLQLDASAGPPNPPAAGIEDALAQWAPYQVARLRKRQGELRLAFADNQRRPAVDLVISHTNSGLANASWRSAWSKVKDMSYPEWYVGLNVELGAQGNRKADAQWVAQARRVEQSETEMSAIRQSFLNDRQAKLRARDQLLREAALMQSEVQTRQLLLDDERQRFHVGLGLLSTLLQAEQDLLESRLRAADTRGRLETARLSLLLADGTLLPSYGIDTPLPSSP